MQTGAEAAERPEILVDTSVAVALVLADHEGYPTTTRALRHSRLGLAGHAAFETFSVLTRMPPPLRRSAAVVHTLLRSNFPHSRFLSTWATAQLLDELADLHIAGGSVYDALVGAVAVDHDLVLATRDRRAVATYRAVGARFELID